MRTKLGVAGIIALGVAMAAVAGEADAPSPDEAIRRLTAELTSKEKQPQRAAEAIAADCRVAIGHLVKGLAGDDTSQWERADRPLEQLCHYASAPGFEPHRAAVAKALAAHVKDPALTTLGRARVIRHIERTGRLEVIPTLAALLTDRDLREPARRALMRNPSPEAGDALRAALKGADKPFRIALIDALGFRREGRFVKLLIAQAADADMEVRLHAVEALARIGSPEAQATVAALLGKGEGHARDQANNAYLALAERLAAAGDRTAALRLFRPLLDAKETHLRCAALIGIGKAGSARDVDTLVAAIGRGPEQRETATRALVLLPDKEATGAIVAKAKSADAALKARLAGVLGQRGDDAAVPFVLDAAKDNDPGVRVAAYRSLGALKAEAAVGVLIAAVGAEKEAPQRLAAEQALARIPGKKAADAIAAAIGKSQKDAKAGLLRALAGHRDPVHLAVLLDAAKDPDAGVRVAALEALALLDAPKAVPAILDALNAEDKAVRAAAAYALRRTRSKEATAAIAAAARDAKPAGLASILGVLSWRGHPGVSALLLASAKHADPGVRAAAFQGLAQRKDPAAVPLLVEAATGPEGPARDAAVRASLAYADEIIKADRAKAMAIFRLALGRKTVSDDEGRRQAARALGKLGDPDALEDLCGILRDRRVGGDAHNAIRQIAQGLAKAGKKDAAVAALTTLVRRSNDHGQIRRVRDDLRKLGIKEGVAQLGGFVTRWWVCGPFPNPQNKLFNQQLGPEKDGADPQQAVKAAGVERRWKPLQTNDPAGVVDLKRAVADEANTGALLYAEVSVSEDTLALLKLGYEEGCVAYLNGKQVHSRAGARFRIDDRQVRVSLNKGVNRLLLKVTRQTRNWMVCARLTGQKHEALAFLQSEH